MPKKVEIPQKYDHRQSEIAWQKRWAEMGIYKWDPSRPRSETFVVDTPPPTVSGSLHIGHVFSFTQTDLVVRYQRMLGKNIFYPIGWDDNGLATERRVQNYFGLLCDPSLPYDPEWKADVREPATKDTPEKRVSRKNFIEACATLTAEDEKSYQQLFQRQGISFDWSFEYATVDEHCRRLSQLSFLDLMEKGQCYSTVSPTMWDIDFQSAVAQAELEDRESPGAYHDLEFGIEGGGTFTISTTRPELLAACVAVVANPKDERYAPLFGKFAISPLFGARVPILPADHADPEKGTGILMVCTFGDLMDVQFWKQRSLPLRQILGPNGRVVAVQWSENGTFASQHPAKASEAFLQLVGLSVNQARKKMVELLSAPGSAVDGKGVALQGEPKPITHPVKYYEKGQRPIEFVPTRQWFIRILDHKEQLLEQGRKVEWHPDHMRIRYEHWVQGLNQDWCISRQRYFGVPFPVWYPVSSAGIVEYDKPILADKKSLPVDPSSDVPPGYRADQRDKPNGFSGDPDVMDTWATSSLTPQIQSQWLLNQDRHEKLFPMDIRPQAHEIIRTWAFYTIVKAWMHEGKIPWKHALISGFIMDKDRKKMSKSKGNVITPLGLIEEHSSDAVRYWAARGRLGIDSIFDPALFKIGGKLCTKLFNASRFVVLQFDRINASPKDFPVSMISEPLDLALVEKLRSVVTQATTAFENFEYTTALHVTEELFWNYCDHYLELVKVRSYEDSDTSGRRSAFATLAWSLKTFLRLLAPVLSHLNEEIWSWSFADTGRDSSVHTTQWPSIDEVKDVARPPHSSSFDAAVELIGKIRAAKTSAQKSLKWEVVKLEVKASDAHRQALEPVLDDVLRGGNVRRDGLTITSVAAVEGGMFAVDVTLSENAPA